MLFWIIDNLCCKYGGIGNMKFCYHERAGDETIIVENDLFVHLYKARRVQISDNLVFRNLKDDRIYVYKHSEIGKKRSVLELLSHEIHEILPKKTHLIWAITEAKNIEKTLPYLNQLGVEKLTLFFAHRSQRNEKVSLDRLLRILIASCEQCGRSKLMQLELLKDTKEALEQYNHASVLNFGGKDIYQAKQDFAQGIFIGPEGGFDAEEKQMFENRECLGISNSIVLKSECAAMLVAGLATI